MYPSQQFQRAQTGPAQYGRGQTPQQNMYQQPQPVPNYGMVPNYAAQPQFGPPGVQSFQPQPVNNYPQFAYVQKPYQPAQPYNNGAPQAPPPQQFPTPQPQYGQPHPGYGQAHPQFGQVPGYAPPQQPQSAPYATPPPPQQFAPPQHYPPPQQQNYAAPPPPQYQQQPQMNDLNNQFNQMSMAQPVPQVPGKAPAKSPALLVQHQQAITPMAHGSGTLYAAVVKAQDLGNISKRGVSDPFVEVIKLGRPQKSQRTKTISNNLNPVFMQSLKFSIKNSQNEGNMKFVVWDKNSITGNKEMGRANLSIQEVLDNGGRLLKTLDLNTQGTLEVDIQFEH